MFCLNCDEQEIYSIMKYTTKDIENEVNGVSFTVSDIKGWYCPVCGEVYFDTKEGKRYSDALEEARHKPYRDVFYYGLMPFVFGMGVACVVYLLACAVCVLFS